MPFLKNAWYVAALADEVKPGRTLLRTFLGAPVALYRDAAGAPVALAGVCPHRFAPLSAAQVIDDQVVCPYHGLRFDRHGACVHNPQGKPPARADLHAYPVRERYGVVWFWPGAVEQATARELPDFSFLDSERCLIEARYLHTRAHYQLSADNALDLSHLQFLHPDTLGSDMLDDIGSFAHGHVGDTVWCRRIIMSERLKPFLATIFYLMEDMLVDRWLDARWDPPALLAVTVSVAPAGMPMQMATSVPTAHWITPESDDSSHYFYAIGAPRTGVPARDEAMRTRLQHAITTVTIPFAEEDLPVLEAQHRYLAGRDLLDAAPVFLESDGPALQARRIVARLISAEKSGVFASTDPK